MSHLLVIIDCAPSPHASQKIFLKWLDSIITFCNAHLMLDEKNELTIIASSVSLNKVILSTESGLKPGKNIIPQNGQFEKFAFVADIFRTGIIDLLKNSQTTTTNDCLLASALGMALCKMNNMRKQSSRILVASCSMLVGSYSWQYMNLMNAFFAAQKMNVPIDGCVFMREEAKRGSILEQGCDLTGGHFLNIPDIAGNLEYLLWIFLPSSNTRESLLLPERRKATHRAACFCHRNIIDIGYVCSVCLSIFCTYSPICSSCQTHFKMELSSKVINQLASTSGVANNNHTSTNSNDRPRSQQNSATTNNSANSGSSNNSYTISNNGV